MKIKKKHKGSPAKAIAVAIAVLIVLAIVSAAKKLAPDDFHSWLQHFAGKLMLWGGLAILAAIAAFAGLEALGFAALASVAPWLVAGTVLVVSGAWNTIASHIGAPTVGKKSLEGAAGGSGGKPDDRCAGIAAGTLVIDANHNSYYCE